MTRTASAKRIILATFGSPGDLQPFIAIGEALRGRGHEVIVATSAVYRDQVVAAKLGFAPVRPDRAPGQQDPDFLERLLRDHQTPAAVFRAMFLPSLRDSLDDMLCAAEGADALVSHTMATAARLVAEVYQFPRISAVMQPLAYLSAYEPPVVGHSWFSAGFRALGPGPTKQMLQCARTLTDSWVQEWHELRAGLDLPQVTENPLWEGQHSPVRSLGLFPRPLGAPQPDWPPQARVTGFPFYRAPGQSLDPRLRQFLENGAPPIVFTLGTTAVNDPGMFYEESAAAARRLGQRAVLVVGRSNGDRFETISDDAIAVPYAPHELLFPHALAIVHQGGIGTLSEALLAGKPMLIMPYGHDQADNAWRASRLGVARVIPRRRYRAGIVSHELARVLDDQTRRAAAFSVSRKVAQERGAESAAELIEAALR